MIIALAAVRFSALVTAAFALFTAFFGAGNGLLAI